MTSMIEAKGAEYVERWIGQMVAKFGTTREGIERFAAKRGAATLGDLTPEQAKAVISDLSFYSAASQKAVADIYDRAKAAVPSCGNCGGCSKCI